MMAPCRYGACVSPSGVELFRTIRALRCSPASFARFIGDFRNAALKVGLLHREQGARERGRILSREELTRRERRLGQCVREFMVPRAHLLGDESAQPF